MAAGLPVVLTGTRPTMAIRLHNLRKKFLGPDGEPVPVIDVREFEVADGQQVALVGSSGSGKTTLLNLIAGILAPDSGEILFLTPDGLPNAKKGDSPLYSGGEIKGDCPLYSGTTDLAKLDEAARDAFRGRNLGFIFQTHHLLPGFTAMENVLLGMSFTGRKADPAWAKHLLTEVGLGQRLDYKPAKLSVGQQQRVAIARALANRPKLVLADEPTGSLDADSAQQALALIQALCKEVDASLVLVSHDPAITGRFEHVVHLTELNRAAKGATPVVA
jgi:ABC-type lipoprotein export system ATPase subunit